MARKKSVFPREQNVREDEAAQMVDDLAEFEDFRATILADIRKDIKAGMKAAELFKKYEHMVAGRMLTTAICEPDVKTANDVGKNILDRSSGKPTEHISTTHKYESMTDQELDQLITTMSPGAVIIRGDDDPSAAN